MNLLLVAALAAGTTIQADSERAYEASLAALEAGDAAAAETSAREALDASLAFSPQTEIGDRPDRGLLFEGMILEARKSYRAKRARYFRALGDSLAAQERFLASRKAYRRAAAMVPSPELLVAMADDPDLDATERLDALLDAYLSEGSDRAALEERLIASGSFRSRHALKSGLDRKRFPKLHAELPDLEWLDGSFPELQAVTDAGNIQTAELYRTGHDLVVYVPVDSCAHCSEQLDGLTLPVMERNRRNELTTLLAFVPEVDLPGTRRIVRLLGMPVGVGRIENLPQTLDFLPSGELRIVARGGMTQIRLAMSPGIRAGEIRHNVEGVFEFLSAPGLPTEDEPEEASLPLVTLETQTSEIRTLLDWIDAVERLEAGPAPLDDFYERIRQLSQRVLRADPSRELAFEVMAALGKLSGAEAAKTRALTALGMDIGDRLLAEVQSLDPGVRRSAPPGAGVFFASVRAGEAPAEPRRLLLQRSFQAAGGIQHHNIVLEDEGGDLRIAFVARENGEPGGVAFSDEGPVFRYREADNCSGLRLVQSGSVVYESCDAALVGGELVEAHSAIVDPADGGPRYYRRGVVGPREPTSLEQGLRAFAQGDYRGALSLFEAAAADIDDEAPYDVSDLVYNRGRALELAGDRVRALELYRSLGDVSYQALVDDAAGRIEGAPR